MSKLKRKAKHVGDVKVVPCPKCGKHVRDGFCNFCEGAAAFHNGSGPSVKEAIGILVELFPGTHACCVILDGRVKRSERCPTCKGDYSKCKIAPT